MGFSLEETLILLAWEARIITAEVAQRALGGITQQELCDYEFAAIGEGKGLAEDRARICWAEPAPVLTRTQPAAPEGTKAK